MFNSDDGKSQEKQKSEAVQEKKNPSNISLYKKE